MAHNGAIDKAVGEFGRTAKAKLGEGGQPEDQLRNPLENLLQELATAGGHAAGTMALIGETSHRGARQRAP